MAAAMPIDDEGEGRTTANQLFHQLNDILKREINKDIEGEPVEVGDKIKGDDGKLHITVQHLSSASSFPISFKPKDDEILEDKTVVSLLHGFKDGESEYEIIKDETHHSTSTKAVETSTVAASPTATTPKSATDKNTKLLKDIAEEPVILSHV